MKSLQLSLEKPKPENTGNILDDQTNKFCNKLSLLSTACTNLHKKDKEKEKKIDFLEKDNKIKVSTDNHKSKMRKLKKKLQDQVTFSFFYFIYK